MKEAAISVRNVSKWFRLQRSPMTLKQRAIDVVRRVPRPPTEEFCALENISFNVRQGEVVGVVGANGSGKSTLLKLLSQIICPDRGEIRVRGRVASLLELGAGFSPELSGRQNVYLYGSILGFTRREIAHRFREIVAFAELEQFIDTPVKNYSSGMYVRLAFAVAINLDPDILLLDEVLAVGDLAFQEKCRRAISGYRDAGKTILLVTHNLGDVERFCGRALLLERGRLVADAAPENVLAEYRHLTWSRAASDPARAAETVRESGSGSETGADSPKPDVHGVPRETPSVRLSVELTDLEGRAKHLFRVGEPLVVNYFFECDRPIENPLFGNQVFRNNPPQYTLCIGVDTRMSGYRVGGIEGAGQMRLIYGRPGLAPGSYVLSCGIWASDFGHAFAHHKKATSFEVVGETLQDGVVYVQPEWDLR